VCPISIFSGAHGIMLRKASQLGKRFAVGRHAKRGWRDTVLGGQLGNDLT